MALYRNIAGIGFGRELPGTTTDIYVPQSGLDTHTTDTSTLADQYRAEMISRYEYLLSNSPTDISNAGFYLASDGTIYQYLDSSHLSMIAWLALDWVQQIENERGTAGTLYMHLNQPVLAKDTAGYGGGASASSGSTTQYSDPIPPVTALPTPPSGIDVINDYTNPVVTTPDVQPIGDPPPVTTTAVNTVQTQASGNKMFPLIIAAGVAAIALTDKFIKKRRGLAFVGGLGLLYYTMSKTTK